MLKIPCEQFMYLESLGMVAFKSLLTSLRTQCNWDIKMSLIAFFPFFTTIYCNRVLLHSISKNISLSMCFLVINTLLLA